MLLPAANLKGPQRPVRGGRMKNPVEMTRRAPANASRSRRARTSTPATNKPRAGCSGASEGAPSVLASGAVRRMSSESSLLRPGLGLSPFFAGLRAAPRRALLLDYDGTLAPFSAKRVSAVPYRWVRSALRAIAAASLPTRIGIVSGRPVAELRRLI